MSNVIDELHWRGLIAQDSGLDEIRSALAAGPVTFYCGFDPTAPSLHHGHLVQLIMMRHLQLAGHNPIALVGGATGLIGDPREKGERILNSRETVAGWVERLQNQISRFLDFDGPHAARMVNNLDWTSQLDAIEFLRDLGKHFRMGTMLAKDTVARRLKSEEGISYTEFSYQILQAYDYLQLHRQYGCTLETGGNDQWGNLVGGMDLIRKVTGDTVHVMTTPLMVKSDGTKFGKSEGGAIWLDPEMMSPYAFYQFWLSTEDADVIRFLKVFTFRSRSDIEHLERLTAEQPHLRAAQKALAEDVTRFVHGDVATDAVLAATSALWGGGDLRAVSAVALAQATEQLPSSELVPGVTSILDLLVDTGLESSRKAARRTVESGGAYLNNEKVSGVDQVVTETDLLPGGLVLIRRGRRNLAVSRVTK